MHVHAVMTALAVSLLLASEAGAEHPSCGVIDYVNEIYPDRGARRAWVQANTFREGAWCPVELQTEAWLWGIAPAVSGRGTYAAPVLLGMVVPFWGRFESHAKHWVIFTAAPQTWVYFADSHDEATVAAPTTPGGARPGSQKIGRTSEAAGDPTRPVNGRSGRRWVRS